MAWSSRSPTPGTPEGDPVYDVCTICGCIYDTRAEADHYAWHAARDEFPPEPEPEPTPEEGP